MSIIQSNFPNYPITEPTSALNNQQLLIKVARKLGMASYGPDGQGIAQVPTDAQDLDQVQGIINDGIRMFINDGPEPNGWKWLNRIAQTDLFPQIDFDTSATVNVSGSFSLTTSLTTLQLTSPFVLSPPAGTLAPNPTFFGSMELRPLWIGGNPPGNTPGFGSTTFDGQPVAMQTGVQVSVVQFLDPYHVNVIATPQSIVPTTVGTCTAGTVLTTAGIPAYIAQYGIVQSGLNVIGWSMAQQGDYTLPADFSGQYTGEITYIANTNRGMILRWTDEAAIRSRRQNYNIETGTPYEAAVRLIPTPSYAAIGYLPPRQRWELMTWRIASEYLHVIFPYLLHFNDLVNLTDLPPSPVAHDEALLAACFAMAEKNVEDTTTGPDWTYYKGQALAKSYRIDAASGPKGIGYFGNPSASGSRMPAIRAFRDFWYQRPTVPVFGVS